MQYGRRTPTKMPKHPAIVIARQFSQSPSESRAE
jgi:hypothetical protein